MAFARIFLALFVLGVSCARASDEAALLSAIRANPADDTARLVYADWLQEHDQPERAEFIRLQVAAAILPPGPERNALSQKADAIRIKTEEKWLPTGWRALEDVAAVTLENWERGFPGNVKAEYFGDPNVQKALDSIPIVAKLTIVLPLTPAERRRALEHLVALPILKRTRSLRFAGGLTDAEFEQVLPHLTHVRALSLGGVDNALIRRLRDSEIAPNLVELRLGHPTRFSLSMIIQSGKFPMLETLAPGSANIALELLRDQSRLPALRALDLSNITEWPPPHGTFYGERGLPETQ